MSSGSMSSASSGQLGRRLGQADDDAVVAPHRLDGDVVAIHQPALDGHRPRRVDRGAERAQDAHPPVADLVLEPLDDDRAVVGQRAGGRDLLVEVLAHVARGERVERVVGHEALDRRVAEVVDLADESAERPPELQRAAGTVTVPERHLARLSGRRRDGHPLERDVLDAPRGRAEDERLAGAALVDHLLVEFADPGAVGEEHAEQPTVGDRAAGGDREPLRPVAGADTIGDAVPHDPGPQLGELLARIPAREQVEHVGEQIVGDLGEARAPPHQRRDLGDRALLDDRDVGDDLLQQHVERVAQVAGRLDVAVDHPPGDDRGLDQVAAVLREDRPAGRLADRVTGAPDPLQAAAHRARRLDLDDEVDRAHVDAELQRRRGDDGPQFAALEAILDDDALLARQRTVVRHHERCGRLVASGAVALVVRCVVSGLRRPLAARRGVRSAWRRGVRRRGGRCRR